MPLTVNLARHSPFFCQSGKRGAQVFHQQHQMEFKAGTAFESKFAVESGGLVIYGVHQDGTPADDLRSCICPLQGVFQQSSAKALALLCLVDG